MKSKIKLVNECWAFVPARSGSKKIKNKNIKKLNGKPLILHTLNFAKRIKYFKKIIFSSDSEKYINIAKKNGNFYIHKRDRFSSSDIATDLDVFLSFISYQQKNKDIIPKYFAHLRPTTPIRSKRFVLKAIKYFFKNSDKYSSLRSLNLMSETAYKSYIIMNNKVCSLNKKDFDIDKHNKPQNSYPKTYVADGVIDIYLTKNILKNTLLGSKVLPVINNGVNSDIDNLEDFKFVKYLMEN
tara:strand:- start:720 stop:1439 length:720 start_codon:yes stop_codon:yes gene_type:complete